MYQEKDSLEARKERAIERTANGLEKAMCVLQESVAMIENKFRPVIRNVPTNTAPETDKIKGVGGDCEYETMIARFESGVLAIANNLKEIAQRSAV